MPRRHIPNADRNPVPGNSDTKPIPLFSEEVLWLEGLRVGDPVTRWLAGTFPMELAVTAITPDLIRCGAWEFDRVTGAEVDLELGWGGKSGVTGSYIRRPAH